jgi:hypothetical protein
MHCASSAVHIPQKTDGPRATSAAVQRAQSRAGDGAGLSIVLVAQERQPRGCNGAKALQWHVRRELPSFQRGAFGTAALTFWALALTAVSNSVQGAASRSLLVQRRAPRDACRDVLRHSSALRAARSLPNTCGGGPPRTSTLYLVPRSRRSQQRAALELAVCTRTKDLRLSPCNGKCITGWQAPQRAEAAGRLCSLDKHPVAASTVEGFREHPDTLPAPYGWN